MQTEKLIEQLLERARKDQCLLCTKLQSESPELCDVHLKQCREAAASSNIPNKHGRDEFVIDIAKNFSVSCEQCPHKKATHMSIILKYQLSVTPHLLCDSCHCNFNKHLLEMMNEN